MNEVRVMQEGNGDGKSMRRNETIGKKQNCSAMSRSGWLIDPMIQ